MFSATTTLPHASEDFIALCQSQVMLLAKTLQADWSAVYLTSEEDGQPVNLMPVVVYPVGESMRTSRTEEMEFKEKTQGLMMSDWPQSLPTRLHSSLIIPGNERSDGQPYQLVLPLIYQEVVLGLLVTLRQDYPWKREEFGQIEKIAETLAIARLLDKRQTWYENQQQQQQLQQQQQSDRLDDLFHQLRNPLTALKVFGKLLMKHLVSDDKSRSIVDSIVREGEHLQELIKDFENNQKTMVDDGEIITLNSDSVAINDSLSPCLPPSNHLDLTPVYIWDILENVVISAESIAQIKNIFLEVDVPDNLAPILGNVSALREVFSNLIDNSIKYTPEFGKVMIKLGLSRVIEEKKYQGILIEDTGYGIPIQDQDHIFERHYRGIQAKGEISGSGLGLAIVKDLIQQMGGIIELSSPIDLDNNQGTRFIIWLVVD
ncbi:MAG: GAF domain-containing sensor histidine kinase [Crocosphaera sp.]|nr:GAF domain-containing sensor histidine kinase [Crocosphaera sp.]